MKYIAAAAVLASVAVAQIDPSSINPCILKCATAGATASGCTGITDFGCICSSQQFVSGALQCIQTDCPDQAEAATALQQTLCAGQGDASAAAGGASAAASETASAAASETPSAAQSSASGAVASASSALSSAQSAASGVASSAASKASSAAASGSSAAATPASAAGALTVPAKELAVAVFGAVAGAALFL